MEDFSSVAGTIEQEVLKSGNGNEYKVFKLAEKSVLNTRVIDDAVIRGDYGAVWDVLVVFARASGVERFRSKGRKVEVAEVLQGTIADSMSGEAVPFAHIRIEGLAEGTSANTKGLFALKSKEEYLQRNIIISAVGFEQMSVPFSRLLTGEPILLRPSTLLLKEVMVKAKAATPGAILVQLIRKIREQNQRRHLHYF